MPSYFVIAQILISILLIAIILMQAGSSHGGMFGGGGSAYRTKRGLERTLFRLTIVLAILFVVTSVLVLVFS